MLQQSSRGWRSSTNDQSGTGLLCLHARRLQRQDSIHGGERMAWSWEHKRHRPKRAGSNNHCARATRGVAVKIAGHLTSSKVIALKAAPQKTFRSLSFSSEFHRRQVIRTALRILPSSAAVIADRRD